MVHERISIDPKIMFGKPVIRGTRVTVEIILRKIAAGMSESQILEQYPHLTVDDIHSASDTIIHPLDARLIADGAPTPDS